MSRRLFVALRLPARQAAELERAVDATLAGSDARRTPSIDLHLTLHFLGATAEERLGDLTAALARRLAGRLAPKLCIDRTGGFPDAARARVLWAGVAEEPGAEGALCELRSAVVEAVLEAGLPAARGEQFHPHLTVARPRGDRRIALPPGFRDLRLDLAWTPEEVALLESRPGVSELPSAGRYPVLAAFPLNRNPA